MAIKKIMPMYICEKCGKMYTDEYVANICCKQYHCEVCGIETERYMLKCPSCQEKALYERGRKLTLDQYWSEFPGNMLYWNDHYYCDLDELIDSCEYNQCKLPQYVYGTTREYLRIDAAAHLEQLEADIDCDEIRFCDAAWKEYKEFAEQWNKKYEEYCFYVDHSIIVMIPNNTK